MDELTLGVAASVAWLIPLVVSLLKLKQFPSVVTMALVFIASFAVATIGVVASGTVDFSNGIQDPNVFIAAAGLAFAESQIVYRLIIRKVAPLERLNEAISTFPFSPIEPVPLGETISEDVNPSERPPL